MSVQALTTPDDPVLQRLAAEGIMQPQLYCDSNLPIPEDMVEWQSNVDEVTAPLFRADNTPTLVSALARVAAITNANRPVGDWVTKPAEICLTMLISS